MSEISRSALLAYPIKKVYRLINDVVAYPQYMDGCVGAEIIAEGDDFMEARLDLAKAGFTYSFTTRNCLFEPASTAPHRIEMELVDGPFNQFSGLWTLLPLGESACKVSLDLQFTLTSKVLGKASKSLFNSMADNLVDALVKRAHQLYQQK